MKVGKRAIDCVYTYISVYMGRSLVVGSSLDQSAAFERIVRVHYLKKLHLGCCSHLISVMLPDMVHELAMRLSGSMFLPLLFLKNACSCIVVYRPFGAPRMPNTVLTHV